jgi:oxygen-independent coproporphyrinogen-3 oxidase
MSRPGDIGVYVHFPWCIRKCPYCDFSTRAIERPAIPHEAYADAVVRELSRRAPSLEGRRLVSVFFGGGTPSLWDTAALGRVLGAIRAAFPARAGDVEVTVECNPSSLDRAKAAALREAGVGRLSIGVQSLDDARLLFLGRAHDAAGALRAVRDALAEVPRVSADLIFGIPGQAAAAAADEARRLLDLGLRHLSAYALTIEPGTQFGEIARKGKLPLAVEDDVADGLLAVARACEDAGLAHYEVSNHAVPGEESRHTLPYWRAGSYVGLGAAAVGCLDDGVGRARRWRNDPDAARYAAAETIAACEVFEESLGPDELVREALMLGLRTREGVPLARVQARAGVTLLAGREAAVARRIARGDVERDGDVLRVPRSRWLHLDGIVADLF